MFRRFDKHAVMPDVWLAAWITPVFKKGAKFEAANYRPVSFTCVSCKLMENIIVSHICVLTLAVSLWFIQNNMASPRPVIVSHSSS